MAKVDDTIKTETKYIAVFVLILSVIMQSVFLIIDKWDYTVLLGNVLGYIAGISNFFLMGLTVQKALTKDENEAKKIMKLSQTFRLWGLLVVGIIGAVVPVFNVIPLLICYIFPSVSVYLRRITVAEKDGNNNE